jgi:hypothetical protein
MSSTGMPNRPAHTWQANVVLACDAEFCHHVVAAAGPRGTQRVQRAGRSVMRKQLTKDAPPGEQHLRKERPTDRCWKMLAPLHENKPHAQKLVRLVQRFFGVNERFFYDHGPLVSLIRLNSMPTHRLARS